MNKPSRIVFLAGLLTITGALMISGCAKKSENAAAPAQDISSYKDGEGMWTYDALPVNTLRENYSFKVTDEWAAKLRLASLRFPGGSGSFISKDGLILTNHHVARDSIKQLSDKDHDYIKNGFLAESQDKELKVEGLSLDNLIEISNVDDQVNAGVTDDMKTEDIEKLRRSNIAKIEEEAQKKTGMKPQVVTLFGGAKFDLYLYKVYNDIRLVFAPELAIAFFGGDPDNFEFPRFDLDMTILRAYENGKPAQPASFLAWNANGTKEKDLIFVSGHPGTTQRLLTSAGVTFQRDVRIPWILRFYADREKALTDYSAKGEEQARQAKEELFGVQNSLKVFRAQYAAITKTNLVKSKQAQEKANLSNAKQLKGLNYGEAVGGIAAAAKLHSEIYVARTLLELNNAFGGSKLFYIAKSLVRIAQEDTKPNAERLAEYRDAGRPTLLHNVLSPEEVFKDLEKVRITVGLRETVTQLADDKELLALMGGKSPEEAAAALIDGTKLDDIKERQKLLDGKLDAIKASKDPLIQVALALDPKARALRDMFDSKIDTVEKIGYKAVAAAQVRLNKEEKELYPDATFTLRLSYGVVRGLNQDGKKLAPYTNLGGAFIRSAKFGNKDPFELPESWVKAKSQLDLNTPFDLAGTNDIIGGNSGSPVVDSDGQLVGLIFDGTRSSPSWNFDYSNRDSRAIAVDVRGMIEVMDKVYGAKALLKELGVR